MWHKSCVLAAILQKTFPTLPECNFQPTVMGLETFSSKKHFPCLWLRTLFDFCLNCSWKFHIWQQIIINFISDILLLDTEFLLTIEAKIEKCTQSKAWKMLFWRKRFNSHQCRLIITFRHSRKNNYRDISRSN